MKPKRLNHDAVPSHKAALAHAQGLGCTVEPVRRTGEVRVHPPVGMHMDLKPVTTNNRRPDASRTLLNLIRDVERRQDGAA